MESLNYQRSFSPLELSENIVSQNLHRYSYITERIAKEKKSISPERERKEEKKDCSPIHHINVVYSDDVKMLSH